MKLDSSALDDMARALAAGPWPGYPQQADRFFHDQPRQLLRDGVLHVPDGGSWHIQNHPNRQDVPAHLLDAEIPQQPEMDSGHIRRWKEQGLLTDQYGRPIHPHWEQLLADRRIGLPMGIGMFYRYGPNIMVDAVIYRRGEDGALSFLLIRQTVTGQWGFPGGFVDKDDVSLEAAARRETAEEAGLADVGGTSEIIIRSLPLRRRDTLHAWSEAVVLLFHGDQAYLHCVQPRAGDDASDAGWFTEPQIRDMDMQDTHIAYLATALEVLGESRPR